MSYSQEKVVKLWFEQGKGEIKGSSIYSKQDGIYTRWGRCLAKHMNDGFVLVNTDILSYPGCGGSAFSAAMAGIGDRAIPVSFSALEEAKIPHKDLVVLYRSVPTWGRHTRITFGVIGTQRCIITIRDNAWVGLVEAPVYNRDYLQVLLSLRPDKVIAEAGQKDISTRPADANSIVRHGPYYLIPNNSFKIPRGTIIKKWGFLDETKKTHSARDLVELNGIRYIRGTLRHGRRRMLSLRINKKKGEKPVEQWYEVVLSKEIKSWRGAYHWG
jgi:hypothetical protein